jgi:hypothetical protein
MSITPAGESGYTLTRHADALHERLNAFLEAERVMFALARRDAGVQERAVARLAWSKALRALRETIDRGRPSSLD